MIVLAGGMHNIAFQDHDFVQVPEMHEGKAASKMLYNLTDARALKAGAQHDEPDRGYIRAMHSQPNNPAACPVDVELAQLQLKPP